MVRAAGRRLNPDQHRRVPDFARDLARFGCNLTRFVYFTLARAPDCTACVRVFSLQGCNRKLVFMSELDVAKEKIAYLKVWLGILLVTDISTFGWLVPNVDTATRLLLWAAVVVVVALTLGILFLHRRIDRHIQSLKGL